MKTFWQHTNGLIYVVESDTFGQITGAAGPVDPDALHDPSEYKCGPAILGWLKRAIVERKVRRINPALPPEAAAPPADQPPVPSVRSRRPIVDIEIPKPEEPPDPAKQERTRRKRFAWSSAYRL